LIRGALVADRIQGQQILVNNTTEVFMVDGKPSGTGSPTGSQRVKATMTPRPKTIEVNPPVTGPALKSSPRTGGDKP
jgi:lipopolysaccharide export system protein LptA